MKLTAKVLFFLAIFLVPNFVYAQESPLFGIPELTKFHVHKTCADRATPHKLIMERYELYKKTKKNYTPVNAYADVITIVEQDVELMDYYIFDGNFLIYNRQFIKTGIGGAWKEVDEKEFDELFLKYMATLPKEYFATGPEANHSLFASNIANCK